MFTQSSEQGSIQGCFIAYYCYQMLKHDKQYQHHKYDKSDSESTRNARVKYIILTTVLLLSACSGPGGSVWGITPANSDICPRGQSASGECR